VVVAETATTAVDAVARFFDRVANLDDPAVFISFLNEGEAQRLATKADEASPASVPLRGKVFAVKDNIDVLGTTTTAGCAAFAYIPQRSATVVRRLIEAGAVPVAKTNLDQFATGLAGTRSPFGTPRNPHDALHAPGGSSSGSAVAVARQLVDFALGTDTAGSGRVPASFCGVVGLKPTVGRLSNQGVVPAVRSADCVSILAPSVNAAQHVLWASDGFDGDDAFSRVAPMATPVPTLTQLRIGTPSLGALKQLGADMGTLDGHRRILDALCQLCPQIVEVDLAPFLEAGDLLYRGPLLAERFAAVGEFIEAHLDDVDPTVAEIILQGRRYSAVETHRASYRLASLRRATACAFEQIDVLVVPTVLGSAWLNDAVADPIGASERLGRLTTFANLVDLCAVAIPFGIRRDDGLPFGATLYAPAWSEPTLLALAASLNGELIPSAESAVRSDVTTLAVVGAHLRGQPLAHQLTDLGAQYLETTTTAPTYRLFAMPDTVPPKPALVHAHNGAAIEVDLWILDKSVIGSFLTQVLPPLALGTVTLADGSQHIGFVAEPRALDGAIDITHFGGWRSYIAELALGSKDAP